MKDFVYPNYKGGYLLNIPSTILSLFGAKAPNQTLLPEYYSNAVGAKKVILFLADGLGFNLFEKEALKYHVFQKLARKGLYNRLTSVFPSSTAPAINALNSGLSTVEHGLLEWHLYLPELDTIVQSLPFIPDFPEERARLENPPQGILLNQETTYQKLSKVGIPSFVFCPRAYSESFYNQQALAGSTVIGYSSPAHLLVVLKEVLEKTKGQAYFYVYFPFIDSSEHEFGPNSPIVKTEISFLAHALEKEFIHRLNEQTVKQTMLFLTADHGLMEVSDEKTIYLDEIPDLADFFQLSPEGKVIFPSGSSRDLYFHIKEERLDEAEKLLQGKLKDCAEVVSVEDLVERGVFGSGKVHPQFLARAGNLAVLPFPEYAIWYRYFPEDRVSLKGLHGGLSEDEMYIPFISARLSDLRD